MRRWYGEEDEMVVWGGRTCALTLFHGVEGPHQDIVSLQVSVDDANVVYILKGLGHLVRG